MITAVYIPPTTDASVAFHYISPKLSPYPYALFLMDENFSYSDLKATLSKLHQHIKCAIRSTNTPDNSNITQLF